MSVPPGTPGAESSIDAAVATADDEVLSTGELVGDTSESTVDAAADDGASDGSVAETDAQDAADLADLESYPESVREQFKSLTPAGRKSLYERAEARVEERIKAERERNDKLQADIAAREKVRQEIAAKVGKYVGDEPITKVGRDGIERVLPSFEETLRLNQHRRGRDELYEKYGLDEDGIEDHIENLTERRAMLDATTDMLEDRALVRLDGRIRDGFVKAGLDPADFLSGTAEEIVPRVVEHVTAKFTAELAKQKDEYEGRLLAANVNAEGLKGRALAGSTRALASGGRSASGVAEHIYTRAELRAMDVETYRANKAEIERQSAAGLIQ